MENLVISMNHQKIYLLHKSLTQDILKIQNFRNQILHTTHETKLLVTLLWLEYLPRLGGSRIRFPV